MKQSRYEAIFDSLSTLLIRYQTGDMLLLSDIGDSIAELSRLSPLPDLTAETFGLLTGLVDREMHGMAGTSFTTAISEGLDLLHSVFQEAPSALKQKVPLPEYLVAALSVFRERHQRSVPAAGDFPDGVTTNPASGSTGQKQEELADESKPGTSQGEATVRARDAHQRQIMLTFIHDARERLDLAQVRVLDLETVVDPAVMLNELFRVFHTFKGETGFLHLPHLGELAHHYENILDHLRNQRIELQAEVIDLLLEGIDTARGIIDCLETDSTDEGSVDGVHELVGRITRLLQGSAEPLGSRLVRHGLMESATVEKALQHQKDNGFRQKLGEIVVAEGLASPEIVYGALQEQQQAGRQTPVQRPEPIPDQAKAGAATERAGVGEALVKVRATQVQYMVDMLGELVISLNQLDDDDRRVQASRKIAKNLQLAAMQAGTVGIGTLFSNMRRVVREACRQLGKEADLVISGDDLEVDRNLVDKLGEPLMHLLRNALGHGIEAGPDRLAAGKPARGRVDLVAGRTGHNVVISVRDDGRGLDQNRIREKAVDKGLITRERAVAMSRSEILDLVFLPGFSTADQVDAISGRGVGMDVVKTMVEQMRGRLNLESQPGQYTEVSLTFPINMAIIDGMIVQIGSRLFIIPVSVIIESLEMDPATFREVSGGVKVCSLRGETMPVIDLGQWFGMSRPAGLDRNLAVVVEARGGKYALLVHDIVAKKEVVIKSLGRLFSQTRGIASGTILQGGRIGLVLDVDQIVRTE